MGTSAALFSTVGVGTMSVLFTVVALREVDRRGRRALLLGGSAGMAVSLGLLAANSFAHGTPVINVVLITVYIAAFAISPAPVVWLMISELFRWRCAAVRWRCARCSSGGPTS